MFFTGSTVEILFLSQAYYQSVIRTCRKFPAPDSILKRHDTSSYIHDKENIMKIWKEKKIPYKVCMYLFFYLCTASIIFATFLPKVEGSEEYPVLRACIIFFATVLLIKYFTYMFFSPWNDVRSKLSTLILPQVIKEYQPRVSVIIPAWNEEVGILTTINSLLKSSYKNMEIVVVNDGSTDDSDTLIKRFIKSYQRKKRKTPVKNGIDMIYRYKENGGKGEALNTGILLASGEIIMSIDADCMLLQDTIANFVKYFADPSVSAAVGNVKIGNTRSLLGTIQALEFLFSFYFKKADSLFNTIYIIGGAAGAFRRSVFADIGLYSTKNITEDIDLSVRIQDHGLKIVYAADAIVYTEGASEFRGLLKQRLRWKRGRFETFFQHRHLFFSLKPHHRKLFTTLILPLAMLSEAQLFLELFFLIFLYIYSALIHDFSSFISGIIVVSSMFLVQILDNKESRNITFYLLAPIGWMLFYITTSVEYYSLLKSIWGFYRKQECVWQKWQRKGVMEKPI